MHGLCSIFAGLRQGRQAQSLKFSSHAYAQGACVEGQMASFLKRQQKASGLRSTRGASLHSEACTNAKIKDFLSDAGVNDSAFAVFALHPLPPPPSYPSATGGDDAYAYASFPSPLHFPTRQQPSRPPPSSP